jgi:excisionase family DNA binding protein
MSGENLVPKPSPLPAIARSFSGGLIESLERCDHALIVSEVAQMFRVTCGTVYRLARNNSIPSFRFGGSVLFDPGSLARWMRNTVGAA